MRDSGKLVEWLDDQGYGFIQPNDISKSKVFLHIKDFAKKGPRPIQGCALEYAVTMDEQGRYRAIQVKYLNSHRSVTQATEGFSSQNSYLSKMTLLILLYWLVIFVLLSVGKLPSLSWLVLIFSNVVTYYLYNKDKQAAQYNTWRVKEQILHLFSFLGGWSTAWFMQQKLRHKTQKQSFQTMYIATIIGNFILVICVLFLK